MRRSTAYVTVGALLLPGLPALAALGGATPAVPVPAAGERSAAAAAPVHPSSLDVLDRLARTGSAVDAAGLVRALAGGLGDGTVVATAPGDGPVMALPSPGGATTSRATTPAGDLDGDGTGDLLVLVWEGGDGGADDGFRVRALSGRTGALHWSAPLPGDAALATPLGEDVTGDGRADLLAAYVSESSSVSTVEGSCASGNCRETTLSTEDLRLALVSGADGRTVWSQGSRGEYRSEHVKSRRSDLRTSDDAASWTYTYRGARWPVAVAGGRVFVTGGDGSRSFSESRHTDGVGPVVLSSRDEYRGTRRASAVLDVLDVATGAVRVSRTDPEAQGSSYVTGVTDVSADGVPDVLTVEYAEGDTAETCTEDLLTYSCTGGSGSYSAAVVARDGTTLGELWRTSASDLGGAYPLAADLDADGTQDLLVDAFDEQIATQTRSGRDGAVLWTSPGLFRPVLVARLDAVAGDDLVVHAFDVTSDAPPSLDRLAGRTGDVLSSTGYTWPAAPPARSGSGESFLERTTELEAFADRDRDGVDDLLVRTGTTRWYENGPPESSTRTALESGRDGRGTVLYEGRADVLYTAAGDVDADGRGDLLRHYDGSVVLDADLRTLWSTGLGYAERAGDLDGVAGDDVVVMVPDALSARQGSTGALRWRHPG